MRNKGRKMVTVALLALSACTEMMAGPMDKDTFMLNEVVVTANRNEVRKCDAPVVVHVLGAKLFETVSSPDLSKSLNYQSGLRVENNCQNCGFPQVRINGLEGPYSQILINSRPVMSALSGVYGLEQIPVTMIERVEVVRGGGSALFGANAVGGTINIITKDPVNNSFQINNNLSVMGGKSWEEYVGANVSVVDEQHQYGLALYQSYRNRQPYDNDGDGFSEIGKLHAHTLGLRGFYRPTQQSRLGIEYHTTNEFRRGGNAFDLEPHLSDITEQTKHIINSGGLTYDLFWNEYAHKLSAYVSAQHIDRNSYYGALQDANAYGKTTDMTWVAGMTYTAQLNKLLFAPATLTLGAEYQQNNLHDVMTGYHRDLLQKVKIGGGFVQNEWKINTVTLLAGLRLDKHNLIDNLIVSPRVNLMWKPTDVLQTRLTWSTGFRAPQAYDEDLHVTAVGGEGMLIQLAPGLEPERSNSFSGSVDYTFSLGHLSINMLAEAFYTTLSNVFYLQKIGTDAQGNTVQERRNGSGAEVYGVNVDAKVAHGSHWTLQAGVTLQQSRYKEYTSWSDNPSVAPIRYMPRTPKVYGYFTLNVKPMKQLDLSLNGIYTGRMYVPHMAPTDDIAADYPYTYIAQDEMKHTPDFIELGAKVAYTFTLSRHLQLQVNGGVHNMLNSFQRDLDKGAYRDSGYFYGPTQPRTIFLGIKILR